MNQIYLTTILLFASSVDSFGIGAPSKACFNGIPQHGVPAQASRSPYCIKLSRNQMKSGESLNIKVSGKTENATFTGLLIRAMVDNQIVGNFQLPTESPYVQFVDCGNEKEVRLIHFL